MLNNKIGVSIRIKAYMLNKKGALRNVKLVNIIRDLPSNLI